MTLQPPCRTPDSRYQCIRNGIIYFQIQRGERRVEPYILFNPYLINQPRIKRSIQRMNSPRDWRGAPAPGWTRRRRGPPRPWTDGESPVRPDRRRRRNGRYGWDGRCGVCSWINRRGGGSLQIWVRLVQSPTGISVGHGTSNLLWLLLLRLFLGSGREFGLGKESEAESRRQSGWGRRYECGSASDRA
jgi:hypothetical protein